MEAVLHRIEALPGDVRYAVTFRRPDGSEQTAVVEAAEDKVTVAEASLPTGWTRDTEPFVSTAEAVLAVHRARNAAPRAQVLRDVDGGWDVAIGNVVPGAGEHAGRPVCTAHGVMDERAGVWTCPECGAQALLG